MDQRFIIAESKLGTLWWFRFLFLWKHDTYLVQCHHALTLSWLKEKLHLNWLKSFSLQSPSHCPPQQSLTNSEKQSKPPLQALVTKRNDCSHCQSVLWMYSAPTGRAHNRKAGGNSVALCCLPLIYIGNTLSLLLFLPLSHTLWCDFTVVTLIQAHFDLALSCCSFSLPSRYHPSAPWWPDSAAFNPVYPLSYPINPPIFPSIFPSPHPSGVSLLFVFFFSWKPLLCSLGVVCRWWNFSP